MADFEVIKNPKGKADIWQHFGLQKMTATNKITDNVAVCRKCNMVVKCSGGTTNLTSHMRRHHPLALSSHSSDKKPDLSKLAKNETVKPPTTLTHFFGSTSKYASTSERAKLVTSKIPMLIIKDLRPYSMVDSPEFKDLIHCLDPRYQVPGRKVFSETVIPDMYKATKLLVTQNLKGAVQVALTTDGWSSRATESYMTITSSHITDEWSIKNFVLQTRALPESHTGAHVSEVLKEAVKEWEIPTNFGNPPIVTDNASNMKKAGELFGSIHIGCYAHTLNLAAQKALGVKRISQLLGKIRRIVAYFHRSDIASHILKVKAEALSLPQHKLVMDVSTRWNSAYDMISRFLEMQVAIFAALRSKEIGKEQVTDMRSFSDDEISLAEDAVHLLKPLKDITTMLCSEHSPTVSVIVPLQNQILNKVLVESGDDSSAIKEMKRNARDNLKDRYTTEETLKVLNIATALDPRFKLMPFLSEEDRLSVFHNISTEAASASVLVMIKPEPADQTLIDNPPLPNINFDVKATSSEQGQGVADSGDSPEPKKLKKEIDVPSCSQSPSDSGAKKVQSQVESKSVLGEIFGDVFICGEESPKSPHVLAESEMLQYRKLPPIPIDSNPLSWWKANEQSLPLLSRIARKYLAIPATSVPSERVFSTAGDILNAQRSRLKSKHLDMLLFLKKNL